VNASIPTSSLIHWIRFSNKIMGSSEYSLGNVFLSYKDGLVLRATDGCLTSWIRLGKSEPFQGEIPLPLKIIRGFLTGEKSLYIDLKFQGDMVELQNGNETLRMKISQPEPRQRMLPYRQVSTLQQREIRSGIDFVTAHQEEGDFLRISTSSDTLLFWGQSHTITTVCSYKVDNTLKMCFSIPYASCRHIVKALEIHNINEKMILGISKEKLSLIHPDFAMEVCGEPQCPGIQEVRKAVISEAHETLSFSAREFSNYVSRAASVTPRDTTISIVRRGKILRFYSSKGSLQYTAQIDVPHGKPFRAEVSAHRLRTALSRMRSKYVLFEVLGDSLRLKNTKGTRFIFLNLLSL